MKTAEVSWRRWALYGGLIAAAYTGLDTYADIGTKSIALYSGKMIGSIIAGAVLGSVAALVKNRNVPRDTGDANPDGTG